MDDARTLACRPEPFGGGGIDDRGMVVVDCLKEV